MNNDSPDTPNKLSRNFSQGDSGVPIIGNTITGTLGTNYTINGAAGGGVVGAAVINSGRNVIPSDGTASFTFSNIYFSIVRYEFGDSSYYDALYRSLDSGHEFSI